MVYDELVRILGQLLTKQQFFKRFPTLKDKFYQVVLAFFKKAMQPTSKLVTDLVKYDLIIYIINYYLINTYY
jgi:dynamin 1-like protein